MLEVDKILKVFDKNGLFNEGVELIGSWCFYMYQMYLGVKKFPLVTPDIDFCIPNPYKGKQVVALADQLKEIGFNIDFNADGSVYFWNPDIKIEFITSDKAGGFDKAINFKTLGIKASALRYMSILFEDPFTINDKGVKIKVPRPVNFCLHKLLVSTKRKKPDKKKKDIEQAIYVSKILDENELIKSFNLMPRNWQKTVISVINRARYIVPYLIKEIESLEITLQKTKNTKM